MPATASRTSRPTAIPAFQRILIATDMSQGSESAVLHGLALARHYRAAVCVFSAVSSLGFTLAGPEAAANAVRLRRRDVSLALSKYRRSGLLEGVTTSSIVDYSVDAATELINCIASYRPDLVVVGTRGRTGLKKMLMGSVAEHTFRNTRFPVMTVGPSVRPPRTPVVRKVLVPIDFSEGSLAGLDIGVEMAQSFAGEMLMLHVAPVPSGEAASDRARLARGIEERMRKEIPLRLRSKVQARVEFASEVNGSILAVAEEEHVSMIVMGVRAHVAPLTGHWEHAYAVATQASCPVLTIRATE